MNERLFVYGTLLSAGSQAGLLKDRARSSATLIGSLYRMPAGYPAVTLDEPGTVHGELIEGIDPRLLTVLDHYEGVEEGLYRRVTVDVTVGLRRWAAWVYVMRSPRMLGGRRIETGRFTRLRRR